jgi:endoglucanase Acf2
MVLGAANTTYTTHCVTAFDEMSVNVEVSFSDGSMSCPLVRGCPYVSAKYAALTPQLSTVHAIMSINGDATEGAVYTADTFTIVLNNDQV